MNISKDIAPFRGDGAITIRNAQPGDLGYIAYRHGVLYSREYNLEPIFETYVLESLVKYAHSPEGGMIWIAEYNGRIAGFIAIVGIDPETAQLRWFLIEPEFRGVGLGRLLVSHAMNYCREKKYRKVFLWTFHGLDTATHLYQSHGFVLTEQVRNETWRPGTMEERWEAIIS